LPTWRHAGDQDVLDQLTAGRQFLPYHARLGSAIETDQTFA
jgi:hypothetical protein